MEQDQEHPNGASDEELEEVMRESSELSAPISSSRAERFYDRMRERIRAYLDKKGTVAGKTGEYLLLAPDVERGGLVFADEHGREADRARERLDLVGYLGANPRRQRLAVHEGRSHGRGA